MGKTKFTKDSTARKLIAERVFNAPRERVWKAWTTDEINEWWGPNGWETTTKHLDFSPGGYWLYGMKCVDKNQGEWFGQVSWGKSVFETIDAPNGYTYSDYFADASGNELPNMAVTRVKMEFFEEDGKTRVVSNSTFDSIEGYNQIIEMGVEQGLGQTWDRLAEVVEGR